MCDALELALSPKHVRAIVVSDLQLLCWWSVVVIGLRKVRTRLGVAWFQKKIGTVIRPSYIGTFARYVHMLSAMLQNRAE